MNQTFHGTCNNVDADPLGQWCVVEPGTCPSAARAHGGSAAADYDYCQVGRGVLWAASGEIKGRPVGQAPAKRGGRVHSSSGAHCIHGVLGRYGSSEW